MLLSTDQSERVLPPSGMWPSPRVGATLVAARGHLWLWGGRGGKDMGTFSSNEDLWRFNVGTEKWETLNTSGEKPEQRSYHTLAAHEVRSILNSNEPFRFPLSAYSQSDRNIYTCMPVVLPKGGLALFIPWTSIH